MEYNRRFCCSIYDTTSLILAENMLPGLILLKNSPWSKKSTDTNKIISRKNRKKSTEENFSKDEITLLTKTISRQVDDIGNIDEFSSFARMPEAEIKLDNLSQCLEDSYQLYLPLKILK